MIADSAPDDKPDVRRERLAERQRFRLASAAPNGHTSVDTPVGPYRKRAYRARARNARRDRLREKIHVAAGPALSPPAKNRNEPLAQYEREPLKLANYWRSPCAWI